MSMKKLEPPQNSQIEIDSNLKEMTLFWKKSNGGAFRYCIILFLCLWLCGWALGLVSVGGTLFSGEGASPFLIIWLVMWTFGGVFAIVMAYLLLRPQVPESIKLMHDQLIYDTGSTSMNMNPYHMMKKKHLEMNPFSMLYQKRKTYALSKFECPEFILDGLADDQRLRFDLGADRIIIGETLKEPEREWLHEVLKEWSISDTEGL
jgi:hypothetical protein